MIISDVEFRLPHNLQATSIPSRQSHLKPPDILSTPPRCVIHLPTIAVMIGV